MSVMRHFRLAVLTLVLTVAGCVAPPRQPPLPPIYTPPPPPPPLPQAPLTGDWRDWPLTQGTWQFERNARGSSAMFVPARDVAALTLRCDVPGGRIVLARSGRATGALTLRTTSATKALAVRPAEGGYVMAELAARDPLLDAMAFSRGRFVIEQAGAPTLVVPAYAEIGRVIEDCRG